MKNPAVQSLLRMRVGSLREKARLYNLRTEGTAIELANRIANFEEAEQDRLWRGISGSGRRRR